MIRHIFWLVLLAAFGLAVTYWLLANQICGSVTWLVFLLVYGAFVFDVYRRIVQQGQGKGMAVPPRRGGDRRN